MFCFCLIKIFLILSGQQMDAKEPDLTQLLPLSIAGWERTDADKYFDEENLFNYINGVSEEHLSIRDRGLLDDPIFTEGTALINVRPMRTHDWSGVGSLIKNYITFVRKPSQFHPDTCADLATLWKLPFVEGKTRLNILVMMTPLFNGVGPHHYNKKYTWEYKGLLVGFDPVAVDSVGIRILQEKRRDFLKKIVQSSRR